MYNWFECKIRYDKTMENGVIRAVTESYLIDALSFTEAEARIVEEIRSYISGEFGVASISRKRFADTIFSSSGDRFYNARLAFIALDEKSGGEKRTSVNVLVQASGLKEAFEFVEASMKQTVIDYIFVGITETAIVDAFPYKGGEDFNNNDDE